MQEDLLSDQTPKSTTSEVLNNLILAQHTEIEQLKTRIENTKLFTFMIIHDLKHPTESLIATLKQVHQQLICTSVELVTVKKQNQMFKDVMTTIKEKISKTE